MFPWFTHRITGLVLIVLVGLKIFTGYVADLDLHINTYIDVALLFCFTIHTAYGVRAIMIDLGIKREKALFWALTAAGVVAFAVSCFLAYRNGVV